MTHSDPDKTDPHWTYPPLNPEPRTQATATRTPGRWQVLNNAVDSGALAEAGPAAAVWVVLYRFASPNGRVRMAHSQIADILQTNRRSVIRGVERLERAGLIQTVKRGGLHGKQSNIYQLL